MISSSVEFQVAWHTLTLNSSMHPVQVPFSVPALYVVLAWRGEEMQYCAYELFAFS